MFFTGPMTALSVALAFSVAGGAATLVALFFAWSPNGWSLPGWRR